MNLEVKKNLIEAFINNIDSVSNVQEEWSNFIKEKAVEELNQIIIDKNLNKNETYSLLEDCFKNETLILDGSSLDKIMPRFSIFGNKTKKREEIMAVLKEFFDKYVYQICIYGLYVKRK